MRHFNCSLFSALAVVLCACGGAAVAADNNSSGAHAGAPLSNADFVNHVAVANMAEVEFGRLALDKSQSKDVRDFAQHMIDDHGKNNADLQKLAAGKNLTVPKELDAKHRGKLDMLKGKSGADFEAAYSREMAKGHKQVAALLKQAGEAKGLDADLQAFARQTLPTVQDHERMARTLVASHGSAESNKREADRATQR